ncbi:MAG: hypothetical protein ABSA33_04570, partial [Candidatus Micrarchaeaceae archaeon]
RVGQASGLPVIRNGDSGVQNFLMIGLPDSGFERKDARDPPALFACALPSTTPCSYFVFYKTNFTGPYL